jgi:hypothetical protein
MVPSTKQASLTRPQIGVEAMRKKASGGQSGQRKTVRERVNTRNLGVAFVTSLGSVAAAAAVQAPAAEACGIQTCSSQYFSGHENFNKGTLGPLHCWGTYNEAAGSPNSTTVWIQAYYHLSGKNAFYGRPHSAFDGNAAVSHFGSETVARSHNTPGTWKASEYVMAKQYEGNVGLYGGGFVGANDSWKNGYGGKCR